MREHLPRLIMQQTHGGGLLNGLLAVLARATAWVVVLPTAFWQPAAPSKYWLLVLTAASVLIVDRIRSQDGDPRTGGWL